MTYATCRRQFPDPSVWYAARLGFARSCAVMSMIGFVLGLGDRHGENILIDVTEGCVVHVDFNLIFHKGEYLPVREVPQRSFTHSQIFRYMIFFVVPFRLTRNMVNGFGPTGVEGSFRRSCESTLRVMRENKDTLLTVIQTFVHDPLLEWINTEARAQQNKGRGQQKLNAPSTESVQLILKRLEGHIVSPEVSSAIFGRGKSSAERDG
ncbi:phosphatidylinositol 3- and 4-kinase [Ancylostoma caninum]|uniref:Serine/threonine-protein kinase ATR n=1 Tax=Ancylostoma caninum TaxID=29170 RepID=A0A368G7V2_ANCCA|nr:phosphatidylinositol 3- and 4-kinase [Ancylostoma caninum]